MTKGKIAALVCNIIKSFSPCGIHPTPFYHSDPQIRKVRCDFVEEFMFALAVRLLGMMVLRNVSLLREYQLFSIILYLFILMK